MIYVPENSTYNKCYVIQNEDTIRAYDRTPNFNTTYNYRDYFIHSDYIYRDGSGTWGQYTTLPLCITETDITHSDFYRVDYVNSLLIFFIFFIFTFLIPFKIFRLAFGRWLKC